MIPRRSLGATLRGAALLGAMSCLPAHAQDWGGEDDDFMSGGDGDAFDGLGTADTADMADRGPWSLTGFLRYDPAVWTERLDDRPLAKSRLSLDASLRYEHPEFRLVLDGHGEYDAAYLIDRDGYDDAQIEAYELRFLNGQQFIARSAGEFEITFGRQIVAWGEGDALSPLDVVNPRDNREPGLADLDDLRLAVLATRIGWFRGPHRIEVMGVHESYFGEFAPPLAEYSPFRALIARDDIPPAIGDLIRSKDFRYRHIPDRWDAKAQGWLGRWIYKGEGVDFGLHVASVLDRRGVVRIPNLAAALQNDRITIDLDHLRYTVAGLSGATTTGNWLFKWELVTEWDKAFNTGDANAEFNPLMPPQIRVARGDLATGMLGITWTGVTDLNVAFEGQQSVFIDEPGDVLLPATEPILALRGQYQLLDQRLTISAAATMIGLTARYGGLARAEALYEFAQGWKAGAGYITYYTGDDDVFGPFSAFDAHDRLFARLRWDFTVF